MTTKTKQNLSCINGIRVLSMIWIIFGHSIEWTDYSLFSKISQVR